MSEDEARQVLHDAVDFILEEDGSVRKDDRYRDFIVARERSPDSEETSERYNIGEVDLPPETLDTGQEFVGRVVKRQVSAITANKCEIEKYEEGHEERNNIEYLTEEEFPLLDTFEEAFQEKSLPSTSYERDPRPAFQAFRIMDRKENILVGFQHYWDNMLLGNKSLFNLWYKDRKHMPLDEPIISIPNRLDTIYYKDKLFILDRWRFEQMFNYQKVHEEIATEILDTIESSELEFHDFGMVRSAVLGNPNMMRKFRTIEDLGFYQNIDMDTVNEIINRYGVEGVEIVRRNGNRRIAVENKLKVWEVLAIFSDDHVMSEYSQSLYQAPNKDKRG